MDSTPYKILKLLKKPARDYLEHEPDQLIFHISDLHLSSKPQTLQSGHCSIILEKFCNILESRVKVRTDDIIIISGDLTDNGDEEDLRVFQEFIYKIVDIGILADNILIIPGNHDVWNGSGGVMMAVKSFFNREKSLFNKYKSYPKRLLLDIFSMFDDKPLINHEVTVNGVDLRFLLINTSIPNEIAKGIFPVTVGDVQRDNRVNIAVMHHHLIDGVSSSILGLSHSTDVTSMRVLNPLDAFNFLYRNKVSVALHGHKHLQYYKLETEANKKDQQVNLISAPSLCEKKYDEINGSTTKENLIGFNVIKVSENDFDLLFFKFKSWNYTLNHWDTYTY
jgi:3',5'-cyclic AMP phosphodiesterase CpdA